MKPWKLHSYTEKPDNAQAVFTKHMRSGDGIFTAQLTVPNLLLKCDDKQYNS